jgi:PAS domain S-box-containing protein
MRLSIRLTIAMLALVLLTVTAVSVLTYRNVLALAQPRALDHLDLHARLIATTLGASLNSARADVLGFRAAVAIDDIVAAHLRSQTDSSAIAAETESRNRLANRFAAELKAKPDYAQFRVIGAADGGRELIRVDHSGSHDAIRIVPDGELQKEGDRDYFKAALSLRPGQVYVSEIDLNGETGAISTPRVPTLRTATPIFDPSGKPFGVIIINVDLSSAFEHVRSNTVGDDSRIYVVNDRGDYLVNPDRSREFSFEFGKASRIQDDIPEFAQLLNGDDAEPRVVADQAGARFGVGWQSVRLAGGPRITVIESIPHARVIEAATAVRDSSLLVSLVAISCALILAILLARSLTGPLVQMTKAVVSFSRGEAMMVPAGGSREIRVLAKAFARMAAETRQKTAALNQEFEERRRIFDTTPDLILITDSYGNYLRVNPSVRAILGYQPEDMIGRPASEFVFADDLEPTRQEMRLARRGMVMRNFQTRYVHKDGHIVVLEWSGVWSEPTTQYFFIGRDMTEQRLVEEKFRLAVEAAPSGLVMIEGGGSIVLINAEIERLFGYKRYELIGQPIEILVPARLRGHHVQNRSQYKARPETRRMGEGRDLYGLRKDGTEFPVEIGLNPIQTKKGLLILSVVVDISERKKAEAEKRKYAERDQLFIAVVESSNDAIVTKDLNGTITGWNRAAERLFGFTATEAIGQSIDIIVPAERRGEFREILQEIKSGGKVDQHETLRMHKNGRKIEVALSVSPLRSEAGEIIGAAKVAHDITESKKAQEALHESERMASEIIAGAMDGFVQINEAGEVIEWNPRAQEILGWSREDALGKHLGDLYLPQDYQPGYHDMIARLEKGDMNVGLRREIEGVRKDGQKIRVEVAITALRRRDGYAFNAFIRDLTEKIAAEEQLRQAQKMESVGQLTGGIAHDFNNMLSVITGTIDILGEAVADKPQLAAITKLISQAADRGAELTGHLLAFARRQPLQPRETDINALMAASEKLLRPALGEQIDIVSKVAPDAWPALVDPAQLTNVLLNLAVNARDAMPGGGKLTLETDNTVLDETYADANGDVNPGDYVMIAVSDTGTGIPEEIRSRIFEPFFTTKDVGKGTGLGLSMVYGFVKQSGGHIKVYSESGQGTTFKIYLPRASAKPQHDTGSTDGQRLEGGHETILIVEDDTLVRSSVTKQLESLGYKTLTASNAAEALALVDGGAEFDLLFTDVIMPGHLNGRQLADEMAKRRSPLKVLFTSGYTENAIIHHGRLDPGVLLLAKPYRKQVLALMLRRALDGGDSVFAVDGTPPKTRAVRR